MSLEQMKEPIRLEGPRDYDKGILVVESNDLLTSLGKLVLGMEFNTFLSDNIPENLNSFMDQNSLDFALLHNLRLLDEKPISRVLKKDKYIAITMTGELSLDHGFMYQRLAGLGCMILDKYSRDENLYENALNSLVDQKRNNYRIYFAY